MLSVKIFALLSIICHAAAFAPASKMMPRTTAVLASPQEDESVLDFVVSGSVSTNKVAATVAGLSIGAFFHIGTALAEEEYEIADLPPPWVPAIFAVVLLGGVGFLTGSLGDVMTEESSLGMQSGARAKKEIDRGRSSYFKK